MGSKTKVANKSIITRPNASSGFWLCGLIPMAYLVSGFRYPQSSRTFMFKTTFITALGLNVQSALYFFHLNSDIIRKLRYICAFLPGVITSSLFAFGLQQSLVVSTFWGFLVPCLYQVAYIKTLEALPQSFTYGEASIVIQGVVLFLLNAILQIPGFVREPPTTDFSQMNAIMMAGLFSLATVICALYILPIFRRTYFVYPLLVILVIAVCIFPVTEEPPIIALSKFIFRDLRRVFLVIFDVGLVGITASTIMWQMQISTKASTSVRKVFHILVVLVFIPGLLYQCTFMYISTGVALALLVVLETLRVLEVAPFSDIINLSIQTFVDEKDAGRVVLTPFYLLIGCSIPLWISPSTCSVADTAADNLIPMLSGVISVGIGDTAASVVGSKLGRYKIPGSQKSIEGTVASIIFQTAAVFALCTLGLVKLHSIQLAVASSAILISSLLEAFTDQVDNLVLPLVFFIVSSLA